MFRKLRHWPQAYLTRVLKQSKDQYRKSELQAQGEAKLPLSDDGMPAQLGGVILGRSFRLVRKRGGVDQQHRLRDEADRGDEVEEVDRAVGVVDLLLIALVLGGHRAVA